MDFSKFSDDNFDVKEWINNVFSSKKDEQQKEAYTATLVTKLQRYIQEVNKSLEDISQQAVSNLPRVLRDVETLKQEASFLWQQMLQVKDEIEGVEKRTSHSMQVLIHVDRVRSRLEQTCSALKEADNWTSLASAIEDIFKSGDVEAVAAQLLSMRSSLQVLKNSPDYEDKVMHLEALKNRLETHVSPAVVSAFIQHHADEAKRYYLIFKNLERIPELTNYYLKCHRGRVAGKWQELVSAHERAGGSGEHAVALLSELYELLLGAWHTETQWCAAIFGRADAARIVLRLLLEVTLSVDPGPGTIVTGAMQSLECDKLVRLGELYDTTAGFARNLQQALHSGHHNNDGDAEVSALLGKFAEALWIPYSGFLLEYAGLETEGLLTSLSDAVIADSRDVADLVLRLDSAVKRVFDEAEQALERCNKLTGYLGACDLQTALEKYFSEFCDRFSRQLRTVALSCGVSAKPTQQGGVTDEDDEEDWTAFQHCVRVITTCGRVLLRLADLQQAFDLALRPLAADHAPDHHPATPTPSTPWSRYNYLHTGDAEQRDRLSELLGNVRDHTAPLLPGARRRCDDVNQQACKLAFDVAFAFVRRQLGSGADVLAPTSADSGAIVAEMPMCALSPSEVATRVGQYLMTLPQRLEPFATIGADTSADRALEVALQAARLPFPSDGDHVMEHAADRWLAAIARGAQLTYVEAIAQAERASAQQARQLVADLDYMSNVVDSLGLPVSERLGAARELLDASLDAGRFRERAGEQGAGIRRLADTVARMRGLSL